MSRKKALRIAACIHSIYNDCTPDSFSKRLVRQVMNNDIVQEGSGGGGGRGSVRGWEREGRGQNRHRGNIRGLRRIAKVYGRERILQQNGVTSAWWWARRSKRLKFKRV